MTVVLDLHNCKKNRAYTTANQTGKTDIFNTNGSTITDHLGWPVVVVIKQSNGEWNERKSKKKPVF